MSNARPSPVARERVVALDGPAASGKTVVGRQLAKRLSSQFVDTGAMYRAVTWLALSQGIRPSDTDALSTLASAMVFESIEPGSPAYASKVIVNGNNLTDEIRTPQVDRYVSRVSQVAGVRHALVDIQRKMAASGAVVMAGRDIGTVVLPNAGLKVFLEASAEVRAKRRLEEIHEKDKTVRYEDVLTDLLHRDKMDTERELSPMKPAPDAERVNTDSISIDEVVELLWKLTAKR